MRDLRAMVFSDMINGFCQLFALVPNISLNSSTSLALITLKMASKTRISTLKSTVQEGPLPSLYLILIVENIKFLLIY
jgi:hypothetical protein